MVFIPNFALNLSALVRGLFFVKIPLDEYPAM